MVVFFDTFTGLDLATFSYNCDDLPGYPRYFKKVMMFNKTVSPLVFVFLIFGAAILIFRNALQQKGIDWQVLSGGNLVLYVVTIVSVHLLSKGLTAANTHSFLRNAYSGILLKLMACAAAAFIYILVAGKNLNKPAIFICMGLYMVYSFVEMRIIMKQSKEKRNVRN